MINIKQIKILVNEDNQDNLIKAICHKLRINKNNLIDYSIIKKSIDARDNKVYFVYEVDANINGKYYHSNDISDSIDHNYHYEIKSDKKKIVIVGSGPCGLFCAYLLALNNYEPIIIERGKPIEDRVKDINEFWNNNNLNINSNISFGEGGAGTFSDGKLNTLVKDKNNRLRFIKETFVKFGAPSEIIYIHNPHIGTDILRNVITNMRKEIIKLGGTFLFNTCLTDLIIKDNKIESIIVNNNEEMKVNSLVLAIGHSARDTFKMLSKYLVMENKPFAVGLRIQLEQELINKNQYGEYAKYLEPASFKLTNNYHGRGIYSFCMCPGGYVINASTQKEGLVINGMSNHLRDSGIANAAIVVTVNEKDYGNELFSGMNYQEELEKCAYKLGNSLIPTSLLGDYLNNKVSTKLGSVNPKFMGNYSFANLNDLFSEDINECLHESLKVFDKKIPGFANRDNVLAGVETRTSSPVRIPRNDYFESNIKGIYPAGEGAGFAGGIVTSAIDGMKVFESIVSNQ